ncbi:hypothetical protein H0H93_002747, partial [Arthromyces matolae]
PLIVFTSVTRTATKNWKQIKEGKNQSQSQKKMTSVDLRNTSKLARRGFRNSRLKQTLLEGGFLLRNAERRTKPDFALIGEYRRQTWNANLDRQMLIVERATAIVKHVDRTKDEEKAMRSLIKVLRGMTKSLGNMFKTAERYDEDRGELVTYSLMDDPATKALFDAHKKDVDEKIAKLQRLINLGTC